MGLKHQAVSDRKWRVAMRQVQSHFPPDLPLLLFLTDPDRTPDPVHVAKRLPSGSGVIYRHFGAADRFETASALAKAARARHLQLLVAADPDLALQVDADGVHWPEKRLSEMRAWRGCFAIQTASAHSRRALVRAYQYGVDAVLMSTIFPSGSPSAGSPMGATRFRTFAQRSPLPLYGLGGITYQTAARVSACSGLSGVSGF